MSSHRLIRSCMNISDCNKSSIVQRVSIGTFVVVSSLLLFAFYRHHELYNNFNVIEFDLQSSQDEAEKTILVWTIPKETSFEYKFAPGRETFIKADCPVTNCKATHDRSLLNQSDAIIFGGMDTDYEDLPRHRQHHQRYIFYNFEALPGTSPSVRTLDMFKIVPKNFFNWTMSHRRDSDIYAPHPYGILVRISPSVDQLPAMLPEGEHPSVVAPWSILPPYSANKTKLIVYFASNCNTSSQRENYAEALRKIIPLDIYGKCGPLKCRPWNGEDCFEKKVFRYKFQLSSENSLCPDYVAERFWRSLKWGAVPVVFGAADYTAYAPPHSYIHVGDFKSPKELADYLLLLDKNDALYRRYFEWRKEWKVIRRPKIGFCQLCQKLNDPTEPYKTYEDISKWWLDDAPCYPTGKFLDEVGVAKERLNISTKSNNTSGFAAFFDALAEV